MALSRYLVHSLSFITAYALFMLQEGLQVLIITAVLSLFFQNRKKEYNIEILSRPGTHLFYGMDYIRHENYNITFLYMVCIGPDCNLDTAFCDIYDFRFIMPVEWIKAYDRIVLEIKGYNGRIIPYGII